jgi:hypothetical protein
MKIEIDESRNMILKEVYTGFMLETQEGNRIAICMRDDTFEINIMPKGIHTGNWHRIDMQSGRIENMKRIRESHNILCPAYCSVCNESKKREKDNG